MLTYADVCIPAKGLAETFDLLAQLADFFGAGALGVFAVLHDVV
jgi:hypothetical protein